MNFVRWKRGETGIVMIPAITEDTALIPEQMAAGLKALGISIDQSLCARPLYFTGLSYPEERGISGQVLDHGGQCPTVERVLQEAKEEGSDYPYVEPDQIFAHIMSLCGSGKLAVVTSLVWFTIEYQSDGDQECMVTLMRSTAGADTWRLVKQEAEPHTLLPRDATVFVSL